MSDIKLTFHAQPYNMDASGFYFGTHEEYMSKIEGMTDSFGQPVEEFSIQFIDGDKEELGLWSALGGDGDSGYRVELFEEIMSRCDDYMLAQVIVTGSITMFFGCKDAQDYLDAAEDTQIYYVSTLRELGEYWVDEGLFGDVPDYLLHYIDYEAIGRDLNCNNITKTELFGETVFR